MPGKDIEEAVLAFINNSYPDEDVQPKLLAQVNDVFLPRGELSYDISEIGVYKKGGYRNYEINFRVDGKSARKVTVRAYLKVYKEIFVAKDTIQRDKIIEETTWCECAATWIGQRPITSLNPRIWSVKSQPAQSTRRK